MADVTISFTIPEEHVPVAMEAFLALAGPKPNGVSDAAWAKERLRKEIIAIVRRHYRAKAAAAASTDVTNDLIT